MYYVSAQGGLEDASERFFVTSGGLGFRALGQSGRLAGPGHTLRRKREC